ncbi:MAG: T9SS type A sorting domain-containing protein [Saprospiraceae bacterium]|nr:T9SS type A sorting domain-containing protein [Saprospiraceae bacterium]
MGEATIQIRVTNTTIVANALESRETKAADKNADLELQVIPNPLATNAFIRYTLPYTSDVTLSLFDQTGRLLRTLEQSYSKSSGDYTVDFQSLELSSGDYWIRLQTQEQVIMKHLVIIK